MDLSAVRRWLRRWDGPWQRRVLLSLAMLAVTAVGLVVGLSLGGHTRQNVGPFSAEFSLGASLSGGTEVQIPPLGSLDIASHDGPAHLSVRLDSLDQTRALAIAQQPNGLEQASDNAVGDVKSGVRRLILQAAGAALLTVLVLAALVFRNMRRVAICGGLALAAIAASGAIALGTFRPTSVEEPRYRGLLTNAPSIIGDARNISAQYNTYQLQLAKLVANVTKLYGAFNSLPSYQPDPSNIRVLHVSDLHLNPSAWPLIATVVEQYKIDMVIDTGDLNDWGTVAETGYANSISGLGVPYVFIQGNHDSAVTAAAVARQAHAIVLNDDVTNVDGLTIAGIADPLFTPDKSEEETTKEQSDVLTVTGARLAQTIHAANTKVDIALIHDPAMAPPLAGATPLILAGHLHKRQDTFLANPIGGAPTFLMVEGSTGGAGLRGLENEQPTPLEMSVLYFDYTSHALQGYDNITVGGTGETNVTVDRKLFKLPNTATSPSPTPSPSGSSSASTDATEPGTPAPGPTS